MKALHKALERFQSSFELTGYITWIVMKMILTIFQFQSSFELTGYITNENKNVAPIFNPFQNSFELTGYITMIHLIDINISCIVSKLFRAYGLYNDDESDSMGITDSFKALSSLRVI